MIVALHADAGPGIGLGHAIRCCSLAVALGQQGMTPIMLNAAGNHLRPLLRQYGLKECECGPSPASVAAAAHQSGARLLVADSYRLDRQDLAVQAQGLKLAWFDDTAERAMVAHIIINGAPAALDLPYDLPPGTIGLLGPDYQVVRPGMKFRQRQGPVKRFLVTYGGADPRQIGPVLAAVLPRDLACDFVVGPFSPIPVNLPGWATLHKAPENMPELMDGADLAISAGGQTLYELAAAALPTIAIGIGPDQGPNLRSLERAGALVFAGWAGDDGLADSLRAALRRILNDEASRNDLAIKAHGLIDGNGANRIAAAVKTLLV
ncbi:MAG: Polysaccharide biosynthesis protein, predicted glycosyltransferase [Stygiobacter sp.]|nr:MAG: Polysaccharide biosynthesis protein, predicted glycosyltransferase [Stygiobacter sp.]